MAWRGWRKSQTSPLVWLGFGWAGTYNPHPSVFHSRRLLPTTHTSPTTHPPTHPPKTQTHAPIFSYSLMRLLCSVSSSRRTMAYFFSKLARRACGVYNHDYIRSEGGEAFESVCVGECEECVCMLVSLPVTTHGIRLPALPAPDFSTLGPPPPHTHTHHRPPAHQSPLSHARTHVHTHGPLRTYLGGVSSEHQLHGLGAQRVVHLAVCVRG